MTRATTPPKTNPSIFHKESRVVHNLNSARGGPSPASPINSYKDAATLTTQLEDITTERAPRERV